MNSKIYTNAILTVIAVLLILILGKIPASTPTFGDYLTAREKENGVFELRKQTPVVKIYDSVDVDVD